VKPAISSFRFWLTTVRLHPLPLISLLLATLAGTYFRWHLIAAYYGHYFDMRSWEIVAPHTGPSIYLVTHRFSYPPLWAEVLHLLTKLHAHLDVPFTMVIKGFLLVVDLVTAAAIFAAFPSDRRRGAFAAALFLLNPVSIMATGYWGQFDNFAVMFLVIAAALHHRQPESPPLLLIWILGSLSLSTKHITLFFVWMLFCCSTRSLLKACVMMAGALAVLAATFIPYWEEASSQIMSYVVNRFSYHSPSPLLTFSLPQHQQKQLFLAVMSLLPFVARFKRMSPAKGLLLSTTAFLSFSYLVIENYLVLPLAFGSIYPSFFFATYTAAAACSLLGSPESLNMLPIATRTEFVNLARHAAMVLLVFLLIPNSIAAWPRKLLRRKR